MVRVARIADGIVTNVEAWGHMPPGDDVIDVTDLPVGTGALWNARDGFSDPPVVDRRSDEDKDMDAIRDKSSTLTAAERDRATKYLLAHR
jgi:hypothetical protein